MDARKRKQLEAAGWRVGSAADLLALSAEEAALVEMRLAVSSALRQRRQRQESQLSQENIGDLAPRVAQHTEACKLVAPL